MLKFTQTQRSAHKGTHILFSTNLAQLEMAPYRNTFPVSKTAIIYNHEMIMKSWKAERNWTAEITPATPCYFSILKSNLLN